MKVFVTRQDMITASQCSRGGREFFAKHGLDWSDFLKNGIDADVLRVIDDEMVRQVIKVAEARVWAERRKAK
jgi:hypothetical protein